MGKMRSAPRIDPRYWQCLLAASIFGTNAGDFVAGYLHIGHLAGLPYLAALFGVILLVEARATYTTALYFWAAIITMRTAATNVGDAFHDFGLEFGVSLPVALGVFIVCVILFKGVSGRPTPDGKVRVNWAYWVTMMTAGVVGTIGGDFASFGIHMTTVGASVVGLLFVWVSIRSFAARETLLEAVPYWTTVALIRTAGTAAGDAFAQGIGLVASTVLTGAAFFGLVIYFYRSREAAPA